MKEVLKGGIIFAIGGAIGAVVSWYLTKKKGEERAEEEIQSVIATFSRMNEDNKAKAEAAKNKPDLLEVTKAMKQVDSDQPFDPEHAMPLNPIPVPRTNYANLPEETKTEETKPAVAKPPDEEDPPVKPLVKEVDTSRPYLLNRLPNEDEAEFMALTVMYYADGTYATPHGDEMEIEEYIGKDLMNYIDTTEKDEVFIRNEELQLDFDIVKDARTYDEVMFG